MENGTYPTTPHSKPSRPNESRTNPAITPKATTRIPLAMTGEQAALPPPASQESNTSVQSIESGMLLQPHSSRSSIVSSQYTSNTDLTSPSSSIESEAVYEGALDGGRKSQYTRAGTPERGTPNTSPTHNDVAVFSPMSIASPATLNGSKRTASGHIKNAPSLPSTPLAPAFGRQVGHRSRHASISSTGSRAGELAASLKTKLGYAMAKVHHGWEHRSLEEVEQLAAVRFSPNRSSKSSLDGQRTYPNPPYGSVSQDHYNAENLDNNFSPPSKRHSANYVSYLRSLHHTTSELGQVPQLQPAVDIRPASGHRQFQPAPSKQSRHAMSPPRTPVSDPPCRPPTLRTETQTAEDERAALQALFQLGSPRNSQFPHSHANGLAAAAQNSPLRLDYSTPRKVDYTYNDNSNVAQGAEGVAQFRPPRSR